MKPGQVNPVMATVMIIITNMIPLYNVWYHGWSCFNLILLFIVEGAVVVLMDAIKRFFMPEDKRGGVLPFEVVFITFFGFFAILVFGRDKNSSDLVQTIQSSFHAARVLQFWPVAGIFAMRLFRTLQELMASGALRGGGRQPLLYSGGGWVLQLFALVMLAPFIADKSPNPMAGLLAIIVLKTMGEVAVLWVERKTK